MGASAGRLPSVRWAPWRALALAAAVLVGTPPALADDPPQADPPGAAPEPAPKAALPADADPGAALATLAPHLRLGAPIRIGGATVVPVRLAAGAQPGRRAKVGLRGAAATVMALPLPAGDMHVRVSNRGPVPLLLPLGETILSPDGPSRTIDRPLWIPAHAGAFVPVHHVGGVVPAGPYVARGVGPTPVEQGLLRSGTWGARIQARNRRFGVEGVRVADASAAYATEAFETAAGPFRRALLPVADGATTVGAAFLLPQGLVHLRIETDAARFLEAWPTLVDAVALDAVLAVPAAGAHEDPREAVRRHLDLLGAGTPESRPTFGEGRELRVRLADGSGEWRALVVQGDVVSLVLLRQMDASATPPTPEQPGPPPVAGVVDRDPRPTVAEERWRDARPDPPGGGALR